jgi:phage terminase large subunit-like protein
MQHACHKMEIGGVADRRLRLVRHHFDAVCLHHANIDRAAAGYSPDRVDSLVWAFSKLLVAR